MSTIPFSSVKRHFGPETTSSEVLDFYKTDLSGKVAIVTGGCSGIGVETVKSLVRAGIKQVVVGARNVPVGNEALEKAFAEAKLSSSNVEVAELDLADTASVRAFAAAFLARGNPLHLLFNNAGVMACPFGKTKDGFETQFGTNHLGHFLLTILLLPALKKGAPSRVIVLGSGAYQLYRKPHWDDFNYDQFPYERFEAYGQSKTANILFAKKFNELYSPAGITANAVHPGTIRTNLARHFEAEDQKMFNGITVKSPEQGAATSIWTAVAPELEGIGGFFMQDVYFAGKTQEDGSFQPPAISDNKDLVWDLSVKLLHLTNEDLKI